MYWNIILHNKCCLFKDFRFASYIFLFTFCSTKTTLELYIVEDEAIFAKKFLLDNLFTQGLLS